MAYYTTQRGASKGASTSGIVEKFGKNDIIQTLHNAVLFFSGMPIVKIWSTVLFTLFASIFPVFPNKFLNNIHPGAKVV